MVAIGPGAVDDVEEDVDVVEVELGFDDVLEKESPALFKSEST